jgi:hypothetical protein
MPTYLYECQETKEEFETEHSIKTELEYCILCKERGLPTHKPKRLIAGATLGKVNLTGHELTAKTKEDIQKLKRDVYSDPKKYANVVGEERYHNIQTKMDRNR